jgi:hypothetical protein
LSARQVVRRESTVVARKREKVLSFVSTKLDFFFLSFFFKVSKGAFAGDLLIFLRPMAKVHLLFFLSPMAKVLLPGTWTIFFASYGKGAFAGFFLSPMAKVLLPGTWIIFFASYGKGAFADLPPTLRESYLLPRFTRAVGGDGSGDFGYLLPTLRV